MRTQHDAQHRRYHMANGTIVVRLTGDKACRWIPKHTPHISIEISRKAAADGLRMARRGEA